MIMEKLVRPLLLFCVFVVSAARVVAQSCDLVGDGICCDSEYDDGTFNFLYCSNQYGAGGFPSDDISQDTDCTVPVNDPACNIPIDGGLSLLALAGGGLATAAMRRRREEEAAQEVV